MFCVSVLISSDEWQHFQRIAQIAWPGENLSRSEIIRCHALAGVKPLLAATPADHEGMAGRFQATMVSHDSRPKS